MAHKISNIDRQEGLRQAWHGLTVVRDSIPANANWLTEWDVEKRRMINPDGTESDYCRVTCTDNPSIYVGPPVHHDTYSLITNKQFLEMVQDCLTTVAGAKIATVGSVCERGRIFASVSIPEQAEFKAAGREFRAYLNFINSHDKSSPFVVNASNVCVVCNNTFSYNLADQRNKVFRISVKHTKFAHNKLENVDQMIDAYAGANARFKAIMDTLDAQPMPVKQACQFFTGLVAPEGERLSTRTTNRIERLVALFMTGAGNRGETRADAFSAVTDLYTHGTSDTDRQKQMESSEFGSGQDMKTRALDVLSDELELSATMTRGQKLLAV